MPSRLERCAPMGCGSPRLLSSCSGVLLAAAKKSCAWSSENLARLHEMSKWPCCVRLILRLQPEREEIENSEEELRHGLLQAPKKMQPVAIAKRPYKVHSHSRLKRANLQVPVSIWCVEGSSDDNQQKTKRENSLDGCNFIPAVVSSAAQANCSGYLLGSQM